MPNGSRMAVAKEGSVLQQCVGHCEISVTLHFIFICIDHGLKPARGH